MYDVSYSRGAYKPEGAHTEDDAVPFLLKEEGAGRDDLRLIDSFAALKESDRQSVLERVKTMLRLEMRVLSK